MNKGILGILTLALIAGFSGSASAVNLLSNPGFETNSFVSIANPFVTNTNLSVWGLTSGVARTTQPRTGNWSMMVNDYTSGVKGFHQIVSVSGVNCSNGNMSFGTPTGTFSIYHKQLNATGLKQFTAYLRYLNSTRGVISTASVTFNVTGNWTKAAVSSSKPANAEFAQVIVARTLDSAYGSLFDDASLEFSCKPSIVASKR